MEIRAIIKYLPQEGEIKEREFVYCPENPTVIRFVTKLNNDKIKTFTDDGERSKVDPAPNCYIKNYRPVMPFLVIQDIKVGDEVRTNMHTESTIAEASDIKHWEKENKFWFKILGSPSPEAVKNMNLVDGQEYYIAERSMMVEGLIMPRMGKDLEQIYDVMCPHCNTFM